MATTPEPAAYALRISDAEVERYRLMAARAVATEAAMLQRAGVVPGARLVDVGCGPAAMLVELAGLVGPQGEVVGVEPDPASRAVAEHSVAAAGLAHARIVDARGDATGLDESAWDVVMIRHVLFHAGADVPAILEHAARLVRPGGHVYVVDAMLSAMRLAPATPQAHEQVRRYLEFQRARGNNPDIGTELHALLAGAGLEVTEHAAWFNILPAAVVALGGPLLAAQQAMLAAGAITEAEAAEFAALRARYAADPAVRLFTPHFLAVGRRPG
jgi:ubiquinone/menaquinone biosynthesis C-methylase UbiE